MSIRSSSARMADGLCDHSIEDLTNRLNTKLHELAGQALREAVRAIVNDVVEPHQSRTSSSSDLESVSSSLSEQQQHDAGGGPWPEQNEPAAPSIAPTASSAHTDLQRALSPKAPTTVLSHSYLSAGSVAGAGSSQHPSTSQHDEQPAVSSVEQNRAPPVSPVDGVRRSQRRTATATQQQPRKKTIAKKTDFAASTVVERDGEVGNRSSTESEPERPPKRKRGRPPKAPREPNGKLKKLADQGASKKEARAAVSTALEKYSMYRVIDRLSPQQLIEIVVEAARNNGASWRQCEWIAKLFASLFSVSTFNALKDFAVLYNGDQNIVKSDRGIQEGEQMISGFEVAPRKKLSIDHPSYANFVALAASCAQVGRRMKQDEFMLIALYSELASEYNNFCDELYESSGTAATLRNTAAWYKENYQVKMKKMTPESDAVINATLDLHVKRQKFETYQDNAEQINRYLSIGQGILALSAWGWGVGLFLHAVPWNSILQHLNHEHIQLAMGALEAIDSNMINIFRGVPQGIFNCVIHNRPLSVNVQSIIQIAEGVSRGTASDSRPIAALTEYAHNRDNQESEDSEEEAPPFAPYEESGPRVTEILSPTS